MSDSQHGWSTRRQSSLPSLCLLLLTQISQRSLHFAAGFFGVQQYQSSYHQLIVIEDDGFIDSLDPWDACPNVNADFTNLGIDALTNWTQVFLNDTVPRLQQFISGVELDPLTVLGMQQLCAYETVALGYSAFCDLFTEEEWWGYEYAIGEACHTFPRSLPA